MSEIKQKALRLLELMNYSDSKQIFLELSFNDFESIIRWALELENENIELKAKLDSVGK